MALAKMKRVFIVGLSDDKENSIRFLQQTGLLHVEAVTKLAGEGEKRNSLIVQKVKKLGQLYESMKTYVHRMTNETDRVAPSDDEIVFRAEKALEELQEIKNKKQIVKKAISELEVWGDFRVDYLVELEKNNVFIQRFKAEGLSVSELNVPDDVLLEVVTDKPALMFFTVSYGHPIELPGAVHLRRPEQGLREVQGEVSRLVEREEALIKELSFLARKIDVIKKQYLAALNEASFAECVGTLYSEGLLFGLQGWIPADMENSFMERLATSGLNVLVKTRDPQTDEVPPTLLKNNWFIKRIEPLLKLYGLPQYRDLDPSYFFAPFMILFFGICLGDAGYGAVFLFASMWMRRKFGEGQEGCLSVHTSAQAGPLSQRFTVPGGHIRGEGR